MVGRKAGGDTAIDRVGELVELGARILREQVCLGACQRFSTKRKRRVYLVLVFLM